MNNFILVTKDQFDELKANQMSKSDKPVTSPKNSDNVNTSPDPKDKNPSDIKQIRENENNIKRLNPPPGLPNDYKTPTTKDSNKNVRGRTEDGKIIRNRRADRSDPKWLKFWNKNIR